MKLITELNEDVQVLVEAKDGKKKYFIEGVFLQSGIPNKNHRIYPSNIMEKEVNRYIKESVEKNKAWGELNHPQGPQINLERASHLIKSLVREGKNYIGRAEVLDTNMGNIVKGLLEAGGSVGVSSRGLGSLKPLNNGINEVMDDFKLATAADIVSDPSAPDAFVKGIMEGVEWFYNGSSYVSEKVHNIRSKFHGMSKRQLEENKLIAFDKFMKIISEI